MTTKIMVEIEVSDIIVREAAFKHIEDIMDGQQSRWWEDNVESYTVRAMLKKELQSNLCGECPFKMKGVP